VKLLTSELFDYYSAGREEIRLNHEFCKVEIVIRTVFIFYIYNCDIYCGRKRFKKSEECMQRGKNVITYFLCILFIIIKLNFNLLTRINGIVSCKNQSTINLIVFKSVRGAYTVMF